MWERFNLNVSLTPELISFIGTEVGSDRYRSASEVVRAALRDLQRFAVQTSDNIPRPKHDEPSSR